MPGQKGLHPVLVDEFPQPIQRFHVGTKTVVTVDHGRTASQDRVAGEQSVVGLQQEADGIVGVSGGGDHLYLQAVHAERFTVDQSCPAHTHLGIHRMHGGTGQLGEIDGPLGVIRVTMGDSRHQYLSILLPHASCDPLQMPFVMRTRVDHHGPTRIRFSQDPGVGPLQGHRARVGAQHAVGAWRAGTVDPHRTSLCSA